MKSVADRCAFLGLAEGLGLAAAAMGTIMTIAA